MRIVLFTALGAVAGLLLGAAVGVLAGIAWVNVFKVSDFEGQSAMLVFFGFAPGGGILGSLIGAIWSAIAAAKSRIHMDSDT